MPKTSLASTPRESLSAAPGLVASPSETARLTAYPLRGFAPLVVHLTMYFSGNGTSPQGCLQDNNQKQSTAGNGGCTATDDQTGVNVTFNETLSADGTHLDWVGFVVTYSTPGCFECQSWSAVLISVFDPHDPNVLLISGPVADAGEGLVFLAPGGLGPTFVYNWSGLPSGCAGGNVQSMQCVTIGVGAFEVSATASVAGDPTLGYAETSAVFWDNLTVNPDPIVTMVGVPAMAYVGDSVGFAANASQGTPPYVSFTWMFGDGEGNQSSMRNASHTFSRAGEYTVELTVVDSARFSQVVSAQITVSPSYEQPSPLDRFFSNPIAFDSVLVGAFVFVCALAVWSHRGQPPKRVAAEEPGHPRLPGPGPDSEPRGNDQAR